jgi:hypothetical protein
MTMKQRATAPVAGLVLALACLPAAGATFTDTDPQPFALAPGANTITGSISGTCEASGGDFECNTGGTSFDSLGITLPAGEAITAVSIVAEGEAPAGFAYGYGRRLGGVFQPFDFAVDIGELSTLSGLSLSGAPLSLEVFAGEASEAGNFSLDYTFGVAVSGAAEAVVPLPASALFLLGGLAGLAALRRR